MSSAVSVEIAADVPEHWRSVVDVGLLQQIAEVVLFEEGAAGLHEIELLVVGEDEIRRINAEYRNLDEVTDVLSFPLHDEAGSGNPVFVGPPDGVNRLGDIVICLPRAHEQAAEYGHSERRELGYLFVHGLLHLLGYDHEEESERALMRVKEESSLESLGLSR